MNKPVFAALSMDMKRVALGYYSGSDITARRFAEEALRRQKEIKNVEEEPYITAFLEKLPAILNNKDHAKLAEDALMYSTIFQNYAITR